MTTFRKNHLLPEARLNVVGLSILQDEQGVVTGTVDYSGTLPPGFRFPMKRLPIVDAVNTASELAREVKAEVVHVYDPGNLWDASWGELRTD